MSGYTRQSASEIIATNVVKAAPVNAEYNKLRDAFAFDSAGTTGHKHDGSSDEGSYVPLIADVDGLNKVSVDTSNNRVGVFVEVSSSAVEQVRFQDGAILPVTDDDIDLGAVGAEFKDIYIDGVAYIDDIRGPLTGDVTGNITSTGTSTFTTVDINGGAIDATTIGASTAAAITGTTITASTGFVGGLTGNVTGDLTGNVTGNITGDVTGDLTGNVTGNLTGNVAGDVTGNLTGNVTGDLTGDVTGNITSSGSSTFSGTITVPTPTSSTDAATKAYVDSQLDITISDFAITESGTDLNFSYSGGTVATLDSTGTFNAVALSVGGTQITSTPAELNILDGATLSTTELNYVDGVTSSIQTQLNSLSSSISGIDVSINGLSDGYTGSSDSSIGLGLNALANDDGTNSGNIAVGKAAMSAFVPGNSNIAIGTDAGERITGSFNIAVGNTAMRGTSTLSGWSNIAIGYGSGSSITSASNNTLVGVSSGDSITSGSSNCFFGRSSGFYLTTASDNVFIGKESGTNVTTGPENVVVGNLAFDLATTGGRNVAIGYQAMSSGVVTSASGYNVAVGYRSGSAITSGTGNTLVGKGSGSSINTGTNNTLMGNDAGNSLTTGTNNTVIGHNADGSSATVSNEITLGNSSVATLRCQQTTITALSDERDKENITDLSLGLDYINKVRPVEFDWNTREGSSWDGKHVAGFIAQELMSVEDEYNAEFLGSVLRNNPDRLEAGPAALIPVMVKAIQELSEKVKELEVKLETLK